MTLCRFSSYDWTCDVYVYEAVEGGYTVHVAANRLRFERPVPPKVSVETDGVEAWIARQMEITRLVAESDRVRIGLPFDGVSLYGLSAEDASDQLCSLRELGYRVPQPVLDALAEEQQQGAQPRTEQTTT